MVKVTASRKEEELAGPAIFFGATKPPTRPEIVSQIPSKYTTDILIGRYFNSYDPATRKSALPFYFPGRALTAIDILHGPTFHKQVQII
jgi:hypothetical protein